MGKQLALVCVFGFYAAACTSSSGDENLVAGFNPPPVPDGYTRYVAPPVLALHPGEDKMFCQWVDVASLADADVIDFKGYQTVTGHHVVLYSSSELEKVGTTRECTTEDMISVEYLGAIGGEGAAAIKLPDGVVFRYGKGRSVMLNTHYLNATDKTVDVQSVVDVKLGPPSPTRKAAGMAVINYSDLVIPADNPSYGVDVYGTWPTDTSLITFSNHMHATGVSAKSEVKHADGTIEQLASDPSWAPEEAFNPTFSKWTLDAPMVIHAGDQVHLNCTWKNTTTSPVMFPDEMCDAFGFYLENSAQLIVDAAPATGM